MSHDNSPVLGMSLHPQPSYQSILQQNFAASTDHSDPVSSSQPKKRKIVREPPLLPSEVHPPLHLDVATWVELGGNLNMLPGLPSSSASGSGSKAKPVSVAAPAKKGPRIKKSKPEAPKRSESCDVCRARKVKCVREPGAIRCEGCAALDQDCVNTHERRKPGPSNSFSRRIYSSQPQRPTTPKTGSADEHRPFSLFQPDNDLRQESQPNPQGEPHQSRSHSQTAFNPSFMPPPPVPWSPPNPAGSLHLFDAITDPSFEEHFDAQFGGPQIRAGMEFTSDMSFLPISPQSLMHPQPGEPDSASDGTPSGRWSWIPGFDDIWEPKGNDAWPERPFTDSGSHGRDTRGSGSAQMPDLSIPFHNDAQADSLSGSTSNPASTSSQSGHAAPPFQQADSRSRDHLMAASHDRAHPPPLPSRSQVEQATRMLGKVARLEDVAPLSTITRILQGYYAHLYALMPIVHWPSFSQQLVAREDERSEPWRAFVLSLVAYSIIQLPRSAVAFLPVRDLRRLHQRCHAESRKLQQRSYVEVRLIHISTLYCDHIYLGTLGRTHIANVVLAEAIRLAQIMNLHDERLGDHVTNVIERETRRRVFWLLYGSDRTISALTSVPMHIQDSDIHLPLPLAIDDALLTAAGAFPQPSHITPLLAGFHFNCQLFRLLGAVQTAQRELPSQSTSTALESILQLPPIPIHIRPSCDFMDALNRIIYNLPGALQLINPTTTPSTANEGDAGGISLGGADRDSGFATCRANLLVSQAMVRFSIRQYARAAGEMETDPEARDWAERDVLHLLEGMSSESLAANGESLRRKVLFVASSLLEKHPSSAEGHSYVTDFLAVYNRISEEQHVALLEASAAPSREQSPARRLSVSAGPSG